MTSKLDRGIINSSGEDNSIVTGEHGEQLRSNGDKTAGMGTITAGIYVKVLWERTSDEYIKFE